VRRTKYPEDYVYRFMLLANRLGLTFNSGIYARLDVQKVQAACEVQNRAVGRGHARSADDLRRVRH
jgi:hypothetical protein